jgi:hypothetical protein
VLEITHDDSLLITITLEDYGERDKHLVITPKELTKKENMEYYITVKGRKE